MFGTDEFVIKPKDFADQISKTDGVKESLSVWRRKRLQKGKDILPRQKGYCSSCLFCVQGGSIFRCNNQKSKNYGYFVDTDTTCKYYLADNY